MKKIQPIKELDITVGEEKLTLLRQEMLNDPVLGDILTNYERLLNDISELEYEISKSVHAKRSMHAELQQRAMAYVQNKMKPKEDESA